MSERTVWLLTRAINAYDQEGDYFVAVFSAKPSAVALQAHGVSASAVEHVLRGGGREKFEEEWFRLEEILPGDGA